MKTRIAVGVVTFGFLTLTGCTSPHPAASPPVHPKVCCESATETLPAPQDYSVKVAVLDPQYALTTYTKTADGVIVEIAAPTTHGTVATFQHHSPITQEYGPETTARVSNGTVVLHLNKIGEYNIFVSDTWIGSLILALE